MAATQPADQEKMVRTIARSIPGAKLAKASDYARLRVGDRTIAWLSPRPASRVYQEPYLRVDHIPEDVRIERAPAEIRKAVGTRKSGAHGLVRADAGHLDALVRYLNWAADRLGAGGGTTAHTA